MTNDSDFKREWEIKCAKHFWEQTNNPLYVWHAVDLCLNQEPRWQTPEWCLNTIAQSSANINTLKKQYLMTMSETARDDRSQVGVRCWEEVKVGLPSALGLASNKKKNMFSRMHDDIYAVKAHLETLSPSQVGIQTGLSPVTIDQDGMPRTATAAPVKGTKERVEEQQSVSPDRAKRIITRGAKLSGNG